MIQRWRRRSGRIIAQPSGASYSGKRFARLRSMRVVFDRFVRTSDPPPGEQRPQRRLRLAGSTAAGSLAHQRLGDRAVRLPRGRNSSANATPARAYSFESADHELGDPSDTVHNLRRYTRRHRRSTVDARTHRSLLPVRPREAPTPLSAAAAAASRPARSSRSGATRRRRGRVSPWKYSWNSTWSRKCGSSCRRRLLAEHRAARRRSSRRKMPRQPLRELVGDLVDRVIAAGAGRALDLEVVAVVVVELLQRLDDQVVDRQPDRPAPVGVAAEQAATSIRRAGTRPQNALPFHVEHVGMLARDACESARTP